MRDEAKQEIHTHDIAANTSENVIGDGERDEVKSVEYSHTNVK